MSITYFRPRDRFDFSRDSLDIGNLLSWSHAHFRKLFFKRVFAIGEDRIEEFYQRHLAYYLATHPEGSEEVIFYVFIGTHRTPAESIGRKGYIR